MANIRYWNDVAIGKFYSWFQSWLFAISIKHNAKLLTVLNETLLIKINILWTYLYERKKTTTTKRGWLYFWLYAVHCVRTTSNLLVQAFYDLVSIAVNVITNYRYVRQIRKHTYNACSLRILCTILAIHMHIHNVIQRKATHSYSRFGFFVFAAMKNCF